MPGYFKPKAVGPNSSKGKKKIKDQGGSEVRASGHSKVPSEPKPIPKKWLFSANALEASRMLGELNPMRTHVHERRRVKPGTSPLR